MKFLDMVSTPTSKVNLQGQGYRATSRSLEDVLEASSKTEAKLIGYDETAIVVVVLDAIVIESLGMEDPPNVASNPKPNLLEPQSTDTLLFPVEILFVGMPVRATEEFVLECIGNPYLKEKVVVEHAIEFTIWLLKLIGHV
ncbi:endoribonuclease Dicer [Ancistrocladus abbreviatus]